MNRKEADQLHEALVETAAQAVLITRDEIAALRAELLAEIERAALSYEGVYQPGKSYSKNNAVTFKGSLWIARSDFPSGPPPGNQWQLAVKAGRPARDR